MRSRETECVFGRQSAYLGERMCGRKTGMCSGDGMCVRETECVFGKEIVWSRYVWETKCVIGRQGVYSADRMYGRETECVFGRWNFCSGGRISIRKP